MNQNISAAAISRILNSAGIQKASTRDIWSTGFVVQGYEVVVEVSFQSTDTEQVRRELERAVEVISEHKGSRRYFARFSPEIDGRLVVRVVIWDDTCPAQNAQREAVAKEKAAKEHTAAPEIQDVKQALRAYSQYDADLYGTGYKVERLEEDSRLVRIRQVEGAHATYSMDRDDHIRQTLNNYSRVCEEAGFVTQIREDEMSVIVAMPGEWADESPEQVKLKLAALRGAVEDDLSMSTRRGHSNHSIIVIHQVPFKEKSRRIHVFYSEGVFKSYGRFGGVEVFESKHLIDVVFYVRQMLAA